MPALRWNCLESGCYNLKLRPKIEVFDDCFPGRIAFGDVDALVEMGGNFCLLEWKSDGGVLHSAQARAAEEFTKLKNGNVVFVIDGNAKTMEVQRYCIFINGKQKDWIRADLPMVHGRIRAWAEFAGKQQHLRLIEGGR